MGYVEVSPELEEQVLLRTLATNAQRRARARAAFLKATPDGMENGRWLEIVNEYHREVRDWELAEDAYIKYVNSH